MTACARRTPTGRCLAEATHTVVADEPYLSHRPGAPACAPACLEHAEAQARRARAAGIYPSARVVALAEVPAPADPSRPAGPVQLELLAGVGR